MDPNRKYKDSVFSLYMRSNTRNLVEIYNAFEGTNFPLDTPVEVNTLEDALYRDRINDVSFVLNGELIVLVEHQSTQNENMPLRMLLYMGRLYEKYLDIIDKQALYRKKTLKIPTPKFYVVYTGYDDVPEKETLHLSDAFIKQEPNPMLDMRVEVFNINAEMDPNIIAMSDSLRQYSLFVHQVNEARKNGKALEIAIQDAVRFCINNDIMREFLNTHASEVENMLFTEWKMSEALKIEHEEGLEEGIVKGREEGLEEGIVKGRKEGREEGHEEGLEEGLVKGREEGRKEGREEGSTNLQNAFSSLMERLQKAGRYDEFAGAITDPEKAKALFREFGIPNPYA